MSDLAQLFGLGVDVSGLLAKLDDPSDVHVPGPLSGKGLKAYRVKTPGATIVRKGAIADLAEGFMRRSRRMVQSVKSAPAGPTRTSDQVLNSAPVKAAGAVRAGAARVGQAVKDAPGTTGQKAAVGVAGTGLMAYHHSTHRRADDPYQFAPSYGVTKFDDRAKRRTTSVLSAVGAGAGIAGLHTAVQDIRETRALARPIKTRTKVLLPLEVAGLGGELAATKLLHDDTKKPRPPRPQFAKVHDVGVEGHFSKLDDDKQRAYGWASVVTLDGMPVIDRQGDYINLEDIEEAAYAYVRKSRVTGRMHERTADDQPVKIGETIESVVFTPEKCEAMGLPLSVVGKWWMGVQVEDPEAWEKVKKREWTGFSIHGRGIRKDVDYDEVMMGKHS